MDKLTGLTSAEAAQRIETYGRNELPVARKSVLRKFAAWIVSPVSLMLVGAALLSLFAGKREDFWIILVLFFSNFGIAYWHESKADRSIERLRTRMAVQPFVLRNGAWGRIDAAELVPGDVVELGIGEFVPADIELDSASNLTIDESALTGESLPNRKAPGDRAFSGSFISTGRGIGKVIATGLRTSFGGALSMIDASPRKSALERDIISISKFVSIVSLAVVAILSVVLAAARVQTSEIAALDLGLLVAGIPIALPTVMSLIISVGVFELSKKQAIVRRLASLEDLANVDLLLTDKTGTITENKIKVTGVVPFGSATERDVVGLAVSAIAGADLSPLEQAVVSEAATLGIGAHEQLEAIPGDSERKRSTAIVVLENVPRAVSLGAPQVIEGLAAASSEARREFESAVAAAAERGFRALAVGLSRDREEHSLELIGLLLLADRLQPDAAGTVSFMRENGIGVKMLTGDHYEIARRMAAELGLSGSVRRRSVIDEGVELEFESIVAFAEVLPKDKFELVHVARKRHVVAVTGDGVNDLPAVKEADVGFAVASAVDALKGAADIVLEAPGISVIRDAIVEARKIFVRLYNYSVYRVSESFRIIVTIAVIGFLYHAYPLSPLQLILLAFLNDIPIVSLAFDRVATLSKPAHADPRARFTRSLLFGSVGVVNSLLLLHLALHVFNLPWEMIQTMFFLKLAVSGHMLIYVVHTEERWFRFLPSKHVIWATSLTQLAATAMAYFGLLVPKVSLPVIGFVWLWAFFWMQVSELVKFRRA